MSVKVTKQAIGKGLYIEHEVCDKPGRYVDKKATECWAVLKKMKPLDLPGFGACPQWDTLSTSTVSREDAIAKAARRSAGK